MFFLITPVNVANNILKRAFVEEISITPLKLQKLVYFLYRSYLIETNCELFNERFEAWTYGPVVPSIYSEFRYYGSKSIDNFARDSQGNAYSVREEGIFKECLDDIWENYKNYSGKELSRLTHKDGTAWSKAKQNRCLYLEKEDIKHERFEN